MESGVFERFEIWTPENYQPDPILVGVNGSARHLLARWGESDASLVSFDDIKRELVRRWHGNEEIGNESGNEFYARRGRGDKAFFMAFFSALFAFVSVMIGLTFFIESREVVVLISAIVAAVVAVSVFVPVRWREIKKLLRSSTLMQAIAADDSVQRTLLPASA